VNKIFIPLPIPSILALLRSVLLFLLHMLVFFFFLWSRNYPRPNRYIRTSRNWFGVKIYTSFLEIKSTQYIRFWLTSSNDRWPKKMIGECYHRLGSFNSHLLRISSLPFICVGRVVASLTILSSSLYEILNLNISFVKKKKVLISILQHICNEFLSTLNCESSKNSQLIFYIYVT